MQIFNDKKWITGTVYEPKRKGSIIIDDFSDEAKKIKDGHDFEIVDKKIVIGEKVRETEADKIDALHDISDIKDYLKTKFT